MRKGEKIESSQKKGDNNKYLFYVILVTLLIGAFVYYVNFILDDGKNDLTFDRYQTDEKICQNAQISDLCEGLNIAYESGYKSLCCFERGVCC